jgi:RNA polymerase sigma-70 factor, ECF subfamily
MTATLPTAADPNAFAALTERYALGDEMALSEITPAVYQELKRVARNHLRRERAGHTLQPTAIVNEAYARMSEATGLHEHSRLHFFRLASRVMRNVLVDHARSRNAEKHGGGLDFESLDQTAIHYLERCTQHLFGPRAGEETQLGVERDFISLDDSMKQLRALNSRQAEVVDLRFFGGLSVEETAQALDISIATVKRDWTVARAFLQQAIKHQRV